jgi:hypothetical protein
MRLSAVQSAIVEVCVPMMRQHPTIHSATELLLLTRQVLLMLHKIQHALSLPLPILRMQAGSIPANLWRSERVAPIRVDRGQWH